jgi:DNA-directed RNA polymerase subunit M
MDVEFCECGSVMTAVKGGFQCRACGRKITKNVKGKLTTHAKKKDIIVVEDNRPDRLPDTHKKCPKCGHTRAYWWLIQTRAADEPPTQFFRCANQKCRHTWREYK